MKHSNKHFSGKGTIMKTTKLLIHIVVDARRYGFEYCRDCLWRLRFVGKITDKQLLKAFEVLHAKGF